MESATGLLKYSGYAGKGADGLLHRKLAGIAAAGGAFVTLAGRRGGKQRPENGRAAPAPKACKAGPGP